MKKNGKEEEEEEEGCGGMRGEHAAIDTLAGMNVSEYVKASYV